MVSFSGCKINIGLQIKDQRPDGFHNLESIFYPIAWKEAIEVTPALKDEFYLYGADFHTNPEENIVVRALHLIRKEYDVPAVSIHLLKSIPSGAGLGGGSANGAEMLKLLNRFFNLEISRENLIRFAAALGSDCPFFIENKSCLVTGRGEFLEDFPLPLGGKYLCLINPKIQVNTKLAFEGHSYTKHEFDLRSLHKLPLEKWKDFVYNDFELSVFKRFPEIDELKKLCYQNGAVYASMTGTGSTVYGIFDNEPKMFWPREYTSWIGAL